MKTVITTVRSDKAVAVLEVPRQRCWYDNGGECEPATHRTETGAWYCNRCWESDQRELKRVEAEALIDARHARLHIETPLGMALRVDAHRCVRFSDITGWRLGGEIEPTLFIERASGRAIELNRSYPLFADLCAELGLDVETWEGSL